MDHLKHIMQDLEYFVYKIIEEQEVNNFKDINTYELGSVIDMLKDLSQSIYYCTVVKAMEEGQGTISYTQGTTSIPIEDMIS